MKLLKNFQRFTEKEKKEEKIVLLQQKNFHINLQEFAGEPAKNCSYI
ncbi:hypothetical protein OTUT144_0106 [Orientia tsutsugamushi str. UT144]|uniref:Uncharacterized protein n=1 Tax=Orientia tsutsugamushi str. UT144 TaxID=1441384 RepID=A0A0F3RPT1_ORITS|nr:hypothetical protein [Orientia tsutsugamushi]KJW07124.1 hypothetical protein OTUT144_0845 [Orientia tsutsugamushi str. UT144]KJW07795.1 hypothetical protein OTUT144_0106 [Orientia tsutsugamushi str. UT144]